MSTVVNYTRDMHNNWNGTYLCNLPAASLEEYLHIRILVKSQRFKRIEFECSYTINWDETNFSLRSWMVCEILFMHDPQSPEMEYIYLSDLIYMHFETAVYENWIAYDACTIILEEFIYRIFCFICHMKYASEFYEKKP